jgi:hypothetical protein
MLKHIFQKEEEKEKYNVSQDDYLNLFASAQGRKVLCHMLIENHFFDEVESEEEKIKRNLMTRLLRNMDILNVKNVQMIVDSLLDMGVKIRRIGKKIKE